MMARLLDLPARTTSLSADEWRQVILAEDLPAVESAVAASVDARCPFNLEYRVKTPRGRIVWLLVRGTFLRDEQGNPLQVTGVSVDITEKKKAEEAARAGEERYRLLTDLNPDGIVVYQDRRYVYANPAAAHIHQVAGAAELIGRSGFDFFEPEAVKTIDESVTLLLEQGLPAPLATLRARRPDGSVAHLQATFGKVTWEGRPAVQITVRDITEHKRLREKLRITNERLKLAVEGTGEGIWDWDLVTDTCSLSANLRRILGWEEKGPGPERISWRTLIHPDDFPNVDAAFRSCIKGDSPAYECEFRIKAADGQWKWVAGRGVVVEWNQRGNPTAMTGTISDITVRKKFEEQIWRYANIDALTGLPNRRMFRDRLDAEIRKAQRTSKELALLFLDMDGFKQVNDVFGHESGDLLLLEAAHRIHGCVRESDIVARLGGDEFTVVLTNLDDLDHVEYLCRKVLDRLAEPFSIGAHYAYVTASIGVALYPMDGPGSEDLVRKADQAMYAAKAAGKNQFSYFTESMDEKAHAKLSLSTELRQAIAKGQLFLHFQPVVHLRDGHILKAEALLRWRHPRLGMIEPSRFIPVAEESGMMGPIGDWVFREAATCAKRWSECTGTIFQIAVNKSPVQFMPRCLESDWLGYLQELELPGESLVIEITEGMLLNPAPSVTSKLLQYRDAGIQVAIDDFGTGYSSMSYLHQFHIDYLKIDRSFVHDIATNPVHRTIAETIIVMAHKLGLSVIAEGIETRTQKEILQQAGCDYGQGFYFSHPVPEEQLTRMLASRPTTPGHRDPPG
ncbi:PAS domain S-box-containing protein/diguanylate cyclase (GGDEF) domain-containing protein [Noviherbaspirillum humi]|uniref:PAS domain S-box-containing protein/diguanylate cyclase (GGDEF) domain-containing protein n=2 Tax=Noviherbaspirillum humi TaxID=1688639 RepID=A0A239M4C1_9BURK|nr:PAS domain S-box-containing protein/diguanylate cyclase (GGDEF) domain-containing protein [Noviherbaspirillum humi]